MKTPIALLLAISASILLFLPAAGAKSPGTWKFYGEGVLSLAGSSDTIETAVQHVHDHLGRYVQQPDGSSRDPSYKIHSQSWKGEKEKERVSRSLYSFDDADGKPVQFEVVEKDGSETLIFIEYSGVGGSLKVLNMLKGALEKQGVKQRES